MHFLKTSFFCCGFFFLSLCFAHIWSKRHFILLCGVWQVYYTQDQANTFFSRLKNRIIIIVIKTCNVTSELTTTHIPPHHCSTRVCKGAGYNYLCMWSCVVHNERIHSQSVITISWGKTHIHIKSYFFSSIHLFCHTKDKPEDTQGSLFQNKLYITEEPYVTTAALRSRKPVFNVTW